MQNSMTMTGLVDTAVQHIKGELAEKPAVKYYDDHTKPHDNVTVPQLTLFIVWIGVAALCLFRYVTGAHRRGKTPGTDDVNKNAIDNNNASAAVAKGKEVAIDISQDKTARENVPNDVAKPTEKAAPAKEASGAEKVSKGPPPPPTAASRPRRYGKPSGGRSHRQSRRYLDRPTPLLLPSVGYMHPG